MSGFCVLYVAPAGHSPKESSQKRVTDLTEKCVLALTILGKVEVQMPRSSTGAVMLLPRWWGG